MRQAVANLVLYAALIGLLWFSVFGAPHVAFLMRHLTLEGVLVCSCSSVLSTLLMLMSEYPTVKLVCMVAGAVYFDYTSGLQFSLLFFLDPKEPILVICGISVALVMLQGSSRRAVVRLAKRVPAWVARFDVRQRGVLRAAMSTVIWSGVLTVWVAIDNQGGNPLGWMHLNLAIVLIFFACECLKYGALADVAVAGDGPSISRLSQGELHRIEVYLCRMRRPGSED